MFPLLVHSPLLASTFRFCEFDHITSSYSCDSNSYVSNADYTLLGYWHLCIFPVSYWLFFLHSTFILSHFLIKSILCVLPACICTVCICELVEVSSGCVWSLGTGVTDACESPRECSELNPGAFQEQQFLLTAELYLETMNHSFWCDSNWQGRKRTLTSIANHWHPYYPVLFISIF